MKLRCFFIWMLIAITGQINAQNKSIVEEIALNPAVLHGKLKNGLQYYILKDNSNNDKISMRFLVNAGYFDQDADQTEMAHLLEHVGCRATENFPMGLMAYFQSKGLVAGKDINAQTMNDCTQYMLEIPFSDTLLLEKGLLALRDWAGGISFLSKDLEEERSAVYREASNANSPSFMSLEDIKYRILDSNQLYKSDLEQGMQNVINAPKETLLRFYRDWYHPKYQAVFIVGNVDVKEIEQKIKGFFSPLTNTAAREKKVIEGDVPLKGKNRLFISDKGAGTTDIEIKVYKKRKSDRIAGGQTTITAYRAKLIDELVNQMIQHRKKSRDRATVNTTIRIDRKPFHTYANIEAIMAFADAKQPQSIETAIFQIFTDLKRLERYGFSEDELERAKQSLISEVPLDGTSIDKLVNYHLKIEPFPDNEATLKANLVKQITIGDINRVVMEWLGTGDNIDIVFSTSGSGMAGLPTEQKVFSWVNDALQNNVSPYIEPKVKQLPLIPKGVDVKSLLVTRLPGLNATEVFLPNGIKVILKSTASETDRASKSIVLKAISSNVVSGVKNFKSNRSVLIDLKQFIGIDSLNAQEVNQWKKEKKVDLAPYISSGEAGVEGLGDAEPMLQLAYSYIKNSSFDKTAFTKYLEYARQRAQEKPTSIVLFGDSISAIVNGSSSRSASVFPGKPDENDVIHTYQKQFSNPADFTFIITGSFDQSEMIRLTARYLGALPKSTVQRKNAVDPKPIVRPASFLMDSKPVIMTGDSVDNVHLTILFQGKCDSTNKNKILMRVLQSALNTSIHKRLREKEKGVYYAMTVLKKGGYDREIFLDVSFQTAPEDVDRLLASVKDELMVVANGKMEDSIYVNAVADVRAEISERLSKLSAPTFWANYLTELVRNDTYKTESFTDLEVLSTIRPEDLSMAVKTWLNIEDYKLFKLL